MEESRKRRMRASPEERASHSLGEREGTWEGLS